MAGVLIAGTSSDAGKSTIATGLCRLLARRGVRVAPYKAQNMSNNSMVCAGPDGRPAEIGRAQWIQAIAARAVPEPAMNPVLLKPGSDNLSHLVVLGHPAGSLSSADFPTGREQLAAIAHAAFDDLSARYDVVVAEGAGSPTEINLRASDYVNLGLAHHAGLPVVVVADIDRGGVFASMYGTVALLDPADQRRIAGFVVNKFRGDRSLLTPGIDEIERLTGRPVFGVVPWDSGLWLDSEDALDLAGRRSTAAESNLRVAVVRLPRISNFTDVDALGLQPDVDLVFASTARELSDADLIVLPGSRATIADLDWLRSRGLDRAIVEHAAGGRAVLGICGGFQLLGRSIRDPHGVETGSATTRDGLGLLDVDTRFAPDKTLGLPSTRFEGVEARGYEIHHGRLSVGASQPFPGGARSGNVFGTMWHGCLESDEFRAKFLAMACGYEVAPVDFAAARDHRIELLADLLEQHVDVDALLTLAEAGPRPDLPVITTGNVAGQVYSEG